MHLDPDFDRFVRHMNGQKTSDEILQEVSKSLTTNAIV